MSRAAYIAGKLDARKLDVLRYLLPEGRIEGHEFVAGSLKGEKGRSLKVSLNGKGTIWSDFATGEKGGDLLDLWAAVRCAGMLAEAMADAALWLGVQARSGASDPKQRCQNGTREDGASGSKRRCVTPIPVSAPPRPQRHPALGEPTFVHEYTDVSGGLLFYIYRWEWPNQKKEFRPLTLWRNGTLRWEWKAAPAPRPLYGLAKLEARPDAPVLICEGEKKAEVAQELLPEFVVIAWPGGAQGVEDIDVKPLRGRSLVGWPDNDDAGREAMRRLGERALEAGAIDVRVVQLSGGLPPGWDLANDLPAGWSIDTVTSLIGTAAAVAPTHLPLVMLFDPTKLQDIMVPPRRWIVEHWIPDGRVTSLYGDGATGKTLLAQMLLTACAIGQNWLGLPTLKCRAIGLFCEDENDELHRRQADINAHYGVDFRDLGAMRWQSRVGLDNLLMTFASSGRGELTELFEQFEEEARDFAAKVIIIDTAADTFGGDEIRRAHARQFLSAALGRLAIAIQGAVVLLAHPSRAGLHSGEGDGASTDWNAAVRSRLYLRRPKPEDGETPDGNERVLSRKKANYAGRGEELMLEWKDGVFFAKQTATGIAAHVEQSRADVAFLDALDTLTRQGRTVGASPSARNYAPNIIMRTPQAKGFKRGDLIAAMERLFSAGKIKVVEYGKPSDPHRKIVRADHE
jgi:RecA-family ATPase